MTGIRVTGILQADLCEVVKADLSLLEGPISHVFGVIRTGRDSSIAATDTAKASAAHIRMLLRSSVNVGGAENRYNRPCRMEA